jgi:hypothetical protein
VDAAQLSELERLKAEWREKKRREQIDRKRKKDDRERALAENKGAPPEKRLAKKPRTALAPEPPVAAADAVPAMAGVGDSAGGGGAEEEPRAIPPPHDPHHHHFHHHEPHAESGKQAPHDPHDPLHHHHHHYPHAEQDHAASEVSHGAARVEHDPGNSSSAVADTPAAAPPPHSNGGTCLGAAAVAGASLLMPAADAAGAMEAAPASQFVVPLLPSSPPPPAGPALARYPADAMPGNTSPVELREAEARWRERKRREIAERQLKKNYRRGKRGSGAAGALGAGVGGVQSQQQTAGAAEPGNPTAAFAGALGVEALPTSEDVAGHHHRFYHAGMGTATQMRADGDKGDNTTGVAEGGVADVVVDPTATANAADAIPDAIAIAHANALAQARAEAEAATADWPAAGANGNRDSRDQEIAGGEDVTETETQMPAEQAAAPAAAVPGRDRPLQKLSQTLPQPVANGDSTTDVEPQACVGQSPPPTQDNSAGAQIMPGREAHAQPQALFQAQGGAQAPPSEHVHAETASENTSAVAEDERQKYSEETSSAVGKGDAGATEAVDVTAAAHAAGGADGTKSVPMATNVMLPAAQLSNEAVAVNGADESRPMTSFESANAQVAVAEATSDALDLGDVRLDSGAEVEAANALNIPSAAVDAEDPLHVLQQADAIAEWQATTLSIPAPESVPEAIEISETLAGPSPALATVLLSSQPAPPPVTGAAAAVSGQRAAGKPPAIHSAPAEHVAGPVLVAAAVPAQPAAQGRNAVAGAAAVVAATASTGFLLQAHSHMGTGDPPLVSLGDVQEAELMAWQTLEAPIDALAPSQ